MLSNSFSVKNLVPGIVRRSMLHKSMLCLGLPIVVISGVMLNLGYQHAISTIEKQTSEKLREYVEERSKRESEIFLLAHKNHQHLKPIILSELKKARSTNPDDKFKTLISAWPDGTHRNFPHSKPIQALDTLVNSTVFIGRNVPLTRSVKQDILVFNELTTLYGRGWQTNFIDLWVNGPQNISVNYWNGIPWGLQAPADLDISKEEYSYIADKKHNPDRLPKWTGVYFDPAPQKWMVSLVTPVDDEQGNHVASIGHDIILNDLIARTHNETLPDSHNLIINASGRLIVDRNRIEQIQKAQGQLTIQDLKDPILTHLWQQAQTLDGNTKIITSPDQSEIIAISKLEGTDWFFSTLYPKKLIYDQAWQSMMPLIVLLAAVVLLEILFIYYVLWNQVSQPLRNLIHATEEISHSQFDVQLETDRMDEMGNLSRSFTHMAQDLQDSFAQLNLQNETLESQVADRTQALTTALNDLKLTQSHLVQSEKMSALGKMVAGIAHEINNPISFIHGNLTPATGYIEDLLSHLQLYRQQVDAAKIEDHADEIDLDFLEKDLPKLLNSMRVGTDRIRDIILGLRNFSRLDEAELKSVNLHDGIDSTLLILSTRFKQAQPEIKLCKNYGNIGLVDCYPSQFNQVIMNILANGIDALEGYTPKNFRDLNNPDHQPWQPVITITTQVQNSVVEVMIHDNGPGIPKPVLDRIFDPFFTTKPVGQGTGLGLSISHSIIVERHKGSLHCESSPNEGTIFRIQIPCQAHLDDISALESSRKVPKLQQPIGSLN